MAVSFKRSFRLNEPFLDCQVDGRYVCPNQNFQFTIGGEDGRSVSFKWELMLKKDGYTYDVYLKYMGSDGGLASVKISKCCWSMVKNDGSNWSSRSPG